MTFTAVIVFILIFSLLVLVHESGHFLAAKRAGVRVEEFGLGLPPRIWGKKRGGTIWSINWIPFGGFVRLKGENGEKSQEKDALPHKGYGWRLLIITGGVLMNFLLAYVLLMIGFWLGMAPIATNAEALAGSRFESHVLVLSVLRGSTAEQAGIKEGDIIISVNNAPIKLSSELQQQTAQSKVVKLVIERAGKQMTLSVPTRLEGGKRMIGVLADESVGKVAYVWWKVPYLALLDFVVLFRQIGAVLVGVIVHLFTTGSLQDTVSGPVGIAKVTSDAVRLGWTYTLQLIIFLSVNLGIINIVPFPGLDGGRLAFILLEMGRGGKKVGKDVENLIHGLGFILLLALIFAVTYRDIIRLFSSA